MGEDWLSGLISARWLAAVLAFVFGLASGWLFWGGRSGRAHEPEPAPGPGGPDPAGKGAAPDGAEDSAPSAGAAPSIDRKQASAKISAIESELQAARAELEKSSEDQAAFADLLGALDEAVKRANGKLKVMLKAANRARRGDKHV